MYITPGKRREIFSKVRVKRENKVLQEENINNINNSFN